MLKSTVSILLIWEIPDVITITEEYVSVMYHAFLRNTCPETHWKVKRREDQVDVIKYSNLRMGIRALMIKAIPV